jgi:hypothetical protein
MKKNTIHFLHWMYTSLHFMWDSDDRCVVFSLLLFWLRNHTKVIQTAPSVLVCIGGKIDEFIGWFLDFNEDKDRTQKSPTKDPTGHCPVKHVHGSIPWGSCSFCTIFRVLPSTDSIRNKANNAARQWILIKLTREKDDYWFGCCLHVTWSLPLPFHMI